jgi:hypothetical protein
MTDVYLGLARRLLPALCYQDRSRPSTVQEPEVAAERSRQTHSSNNMLLC